jgi:hypothetical protein
MLDSTHPDNPPGARAAFGTQSPLVAHAQSVLVFANIPEGAAS